LKLIEIENIIDINKDEEMTIYYIEGTCNTTRLKKVLEIFVRVDYLYLKL